MSEVKISVIMGVYNGEKDLRQCIDSVLNQAFKDFELICVNDGSTDSSGEILKKYMEKDSRVKVVSQENQGPAAARNAGLKNSTGEYLLFLDADDFFEENMLQVAYDTAKANDADVTVWMSDVYNVETGSFEPMTASTIRWEDIPEHLPTDIFGFKKNRFMVMNGWAWDKLLKASFIKENGLEFQLLRSSEDTAFTYSAIALAKRIMPVNKVLAHHRMGNTGSVSNSRNTSWQNFYLAVQKLKAVLKEHGLYEKLERDYVNYCLTFSMWNYNTLTGSAKDQLYEKLCTEWFEEMGMMGRSYEYFYNKEDLWEFKEILHFYSNGMIMHDPANMGYVIDRMRMLGERLDYIENHSVSYRLGMNITSFPRRIAHFILGR